MHEARLSHGTHTAIARFGGALSRVPADDPPMDAPHVNPRCRAVALGGPPGMSGARPVSTAAPTLQDYTEKHASCTTYIGADHGIALAPEAL